MTWGELAQACGGTLAQGRGTDPVRAISTDSRRIAPGQAFWALAGGRHDAHEFLDDARARAADGWVVRRGAKLPARLPRHLVEAADTLRALGDLAARHRKRFSIPIVGITGSNGKTTVKEMLRAVLAQRGPVCATSGNFNNEIGLPLSVLELAREHAFGVFEMGASRAGDIALLGRIAQPTIGVLTNIGSAHAEFFGGLEGTFRAKSELVDSLPDGAPAILNLDDDWLPRLLPRLGERAWTFGRSDKAKVRVLDAPAGELRLALAGSEISLKRPWAGHIHRLNAAAAAAAASALGLSAAEIQRGLEAYAPAAMRFEPKQHRSGAWLVLDAYNANPESMRAGILTFLETAQGICREESAPRLVLVLGDMKELGPESERMHRELGSWLAGRPLAAVLLAGEAVAETARALAESGAPFPVEHRAAAEALLPLLRERLAPGTAVYFKASRAMKLEELAEKL